ncbi:MAG TPA: hypothetical protein VGM84_13170 [Steroidobacteraceae bacterium]|jgi:hypothetical protein
MNEVNLAEAFSSYKVKPAPRARSAVTADRELVLSCSYGRFQRGDSEVLRYEEDLTEDTGVVATALRTHLAEAVKDSLEIRLIIALPLQTPNTLDNLHAAPRPPRTSFHARKDLVGRVTFFDGQRFVLEFRKKAQAA